MASDELKEFRQIKKDIEQMLSMNRDRPDTVTMSRIVVDLKHTIDERLKEQLAQQTEFIMCEMRKGNEELEKKFAPVLEAYTNGTNFWNTLIALAKGAGIIAAAYFAVKTLGASLVSWTQLK